MFDLGYKNKDQIFFYLVQAYRREEGNKENEKQISLRSEKIKTIQSIFLQIPIIHEMEAARQKSKRLQRKN